MPNETWPVYPESTLSASAAMAAISVKLTIENQSSLATEKKSTIRATIRITAIISDALPLKYRDDGVGTRFIAFLGVGVGMGFIASLDDALILALPFLLRIGRWGV